MTSTRRNADFAGHLAAHAVIVGAAFFAAYHLFIQVMTASALPPLFMAFAALMAYGVWLAVVLVCGCAHELGHALAARLFGMHVQQIRLGPVVRSGTSKGARWQWNRQILTRPFAVLVGPAHQGSPRRGWVVAMAGGPIASLLVALLALLARFNVSSGSSLMLATLDATAVFALAGFIGNLIPGRSGTTVTDGAHILEAMRDPAMLAQRLATMRQVQEQLEDQASCEALARRLQPGAPV